ncbi:protein mono-ADP-ribosyltransferase PARP12 [Leptinotarsa decemlineata]|uniref:protein mono-ADP-ribosyltransferase PARP12 n=1 Tax=Leptinotarsa decemlineata TaxID=7539 RepID=UPI003D30D6FB
MNDDLIDTFGSLSLNDENRVVQPAIQIQKNPSVLSVCLSHVDTLHWNWMDNNTAYQLVKLSGNSPEYHAVERRFKSTSPLSNIIQIQRVQCPFLYVQYQLKLKQKQSRHVYVSESSLFHGTKECNIDSICRKNFDWRLMGSSGYRYSKFGCGVSFSPSSNYASMFPRKHFVSERIMFVVKVLEVARCPGISGLYIPPEPADTSAKSDGNVVVKYFDNDFCPEYIIRYS